MLSLMTTDGTTGQNNNLHEMARGRNVCPPSALPVILDVLVEGHILWMRRHVALEPPFRTGRSDFVRFREPV